jgi:atypical dual specificity phosphatase
MPFEHSFNWVNHGILCFGELPGRWRSVEEDLKFLKDQNIRSILSLVEDEIYLDEYRKAGFHVLHVPVDDFNAPTMEQIDTCVEYIESRGPTYVHCYAGYGRSGTIAAAWLIRNGTSAIEAIRTIRRIRPGAIEVDVQFDALLEYGTKDFNAQAQRHRE